MRKIVTICLSVLALTACGAYDPNLPDEVRFAPVPLPTAPAGEADCDGEPCLSTAQADNLFNDVVDALCAANDKLAWLSDYFLETDLPASCGRTE